ncbi:MAG: UvrD-helicase domain-containing protein [Sphingomonas sp.]|uniref:UvrD-helicase domain-containing protein n=1 Tax=Sphingomonas sp. TaxID=28214 RepID=UPI003F7D32C4
MDGFAAVRNAANRLRSEIGATDQTTAADAVQIAAGKRKLTLRPLAADDPELEGAHGLLARKLRQVLYRNDLGEEQSAEVVAHEIGHFELHSGPEAGFYPREESNGGDPNQRIETYGIKERREAQANTFAREFILPRATAKRLFLAGHNASAIAKMLGVAYETTLQQLADGILLPEVPNAPERPRSAETPCNEAQQRAVDHRGVPFLLSAGPGTGKTKTLVSRIADLLAKGVPAQNILALTFSNKAALELAERVEAVAGGDVVNIWTGTFHAFGLDTLRKHHVLFGLPPDPKVVDTSESVAMLEEALPALGLTHYLNLYEPALALRDILRAISRAKDELCTPEQYAVLAQAMSYNAVTDEERLAAAKAAEVATVYAHYQRRLGEENAVDYGDIIMRPIVMMREDKDFGALMRGRFTHVHVDEYQDINLASAMLVRELVGEDGENLWVVGDARQSIYRFRGASASNIARFEHDYERGKRDGLTENYRSTAEIVSTYSGFAATMSVSRYAGAAALTAARGTHQITPSLLTASDEAAEMDALAGTIRELQRSGTALRNQTVLSRSNGNLARYAEELEARDVPVLYLGPLFERREVRDLLCVLALIADDSGTSLIRVAEFPEYAIPQADALALILHARSTEQRLFDLLTRLEEVNDLSSAGRAGLLKLGQHLHGATQGTTPWLLISQFLFETSDYVRTVLSGQAASDDMRRVAVRQLIDCLRNMPVRGNRTPIRRALDRIRHMILLADERDLRQLPPELDALDGVRLMTVHASKGLEFEAVHLPGLYAGAIPSANRPPVCPPPAGMIVQIQDEDAHEAEEECILFVALSRAKSQLRLYRPGRRGTRNANPSRFLERVTTTVAICEKPVQRITPVVKLNAILLPPPPAELSASDIDNFTSCPRRFYYERVLNLRRRTRAGAYLDAHGCVQAVMRYARELDEAQTYDPAEAERIFEEAWAASGLADHAFGEAYRRLVLTMLARLHVAAAGTATRPGALATTIGGSTIGALADRIFEIDGTLVIRNLRSGKPSSGDPDRLSATILLKAASETFGANARVENHYLLGEPVLPIGQTTAKYNKRIADCETAIGDIAAGLYPAVTSDFRCPRCPYLFVCPSPEGLSPS